MSSLNHLDKIRALMPVTGFARPLVLRAMKQKHRKAKGVAVPASLARFLSQFDGARLLQEDPSALVWECPYNPVLMHATNRYLPDLEEHCFGAIEKDGGAVIRSDSFRYFVLFPANLSTFRSLFVEAGFGEDDFVVLSTGKPEHPELNAPQRVQQRLTAALALFDEMAASHPMRLTHISKTSATISTQGKPDKAWAEQWSERIWDYYQQHKTTAKHKPALDKPGLFTKRDCSRLARKGTFLIGGP